MQRTIERHGLVFMSRDRLVVFTKQLQACALYLAEPGRQMSGSFTSTILNERPNRNISFNHFVQPERSSAFFEGGEMHPDVHWLVDIEIESMSSFSSATNMVVQ